MDHKETRANRALLEAKEDLERMEEMVKRAHVVRLV